MPVLPLVESSRIFPGASLPNRRASATMRAAARSLTDPPGLYHSALPKSSTLDGCPPEGSQTNAWSDNRGVLPMRASRDSPFRPDAPSAGEGDCDGAELEAAGVMAWDALMTRVMCPQSQKGISILALP